MGILDQPLYDWQAKFCSWCEDTTRRAKLSLVAPNGSGKSAVIVAGLVLWWLAAHKRGRVVITTKDSRQLDNQIKPAIRRHEGRLHGWKFLQRRIETPTGGFAVLFTTDEEGRAEGWHHGFLESGRPDPEAPLLIIVDEAKSVGDRIFEAIDRCTYNVLLYVSSPGIRAGRFYQSQTSLASGDVGFQTMKVGLAQCPHIPEERVADIIHTYGVDHPFTLSTLHGEFMDADADTMFIIPPVAVRMLLENPPQFADGRQFAFCDFAAGGDECVLAHKRGNRIELTAWKEANTMASIGRFIIEFTKRGLRPGDIYADEGGLGGPMIDRMAEAGWPVNRVNNGAQALNPDRYENRGAEMWHTAGLVMQSAGCILPADTKLQAQLTTRKLKPLSDGRIGVEKKADMKKRGLSSPDRADAVVGVLAIESEIAASAFDAAGLRHLESCIRPPKRGLLTPADFGVHWREEATGWLDVWEQPIHGRAYLASLKAGIRAGKLEWSVFILRKACPAEQGSVSAQSNQLQSDQLSVTNEELAKQSGNAAGRNGQMAADSLVARIHPPCDWDAAHLATHINLLLKWYGNPVIVPDVRNALDILERLKETGASIHRRPVFDRIQALGPTSFVYGWETTPQNVAVAISALARAIREQTLDLPDATTLNALRACTTPDLDAGDTLALAIALHSLDSAQVHLPPQPIIPHFTMNVPSDDRVAKVVGGACR